MAGFVSRLSNRFQGLLSGIIAVVLAGVSLTIEPIAVILTVGGFGHDAAIAGGILFLGGVPVSIAGLVFGSVSFSHMRRVIAYLALIVNAVVLLYILAFALVYLIA